jgi:hypothetical protein
MPIGMDRHRIGIVARQVWTRPWLVPHRADAECRVPIPNRQVVGPDQRKPSGQAERLAVGTCHTPRHWSKQPSPPLVSLTEVVGEERGTISELWSGQMRRFWN